ncbi:MULTISPECIES: hypothetical protein [unclassified Mesorhizobium]|uniref:hypothetical protein n=1 Tax=unclassified Mesorhizobium TaxID=325217 RepID=UPI00167B3669|nr:MULTISPECIES: hypothetical protein [unclassified Mesorhizobium]
MIFSENRFPLIGITLQAASARRSLEDSAGARAAVRMAEIGVVMAGAAAVAGVAAISTVPAVPAGLAAIAASVAAIAASGTAVATIPTVPAGLAAVAAVTTIPTIAAVAARGLRQKKALGRLQLCLPIDRLVESASRLRRDRRRARCHRRQHGRCEQHRRQNGQGPARHIGIHHEGAT